LRKRYFITGAQGFVGRYLVSELFETYPDIEVLGLGRSPNLADTFTHTLHWAAQSIPAPLPPALRGFRLGDNFHYFSLDLRQPRNLGNLLREFQPHVVIHLASGLRDDPPVHLVRTNIEGTIFLIEALAESKIDLRKLVVASSGGVYGNPPEQELPIRESCRCEPVDLYSMTKLAMEHSSRILAERYGLPVVFARVFNIVGAGQDERHVCGRFAAQATAIAAKLLPASFEVSQLKSTRDFVDVRDVARALRILAECGSPGGIYNVASGKETPILEVLNTTLRHAGLVGSVGIEESNNRSSGIPRHFADIGRLKALGCKPRYELNESLTWTVDYYRQVVSNVATRTH